MFADLKKAALVAAAIHLSGVLGHGFVKKITIDGVEYVYRLLVFFTIPNLRIFYLQLPWCKPVSPPPPLSLSLYFQRSAYG
jgi:hypothetical protein